MKTDKLWARAIVLVDMNAFFAAVEQRDHPHWRGQPVAVTNGEQGTCIITCSYEARRFGIHTGMRLKEAYQKCSDLIHAPSRPQCYAQTSSSIMKALQTISPDIEVFSVDEAFIDLTHCQKLYKHPIEAAKRAKQIVFNASGLLCSIGLSGDKTTAKWAAKQNKPNGFTVVPPWEAKKRLEQVPVTELCGIANGIGRFLNQYGVVYCGDMEKLPISILAKRFGNIGRRIWYMCQGMDPEPVHLTVPPPKSMGHGKVMPPNTTDEKIILTYLQHMSEKLACRLRHHQMQAQHFFVGLKTQDWGWLGNKYQLIEPTNDGKNIFSLCRRMFKEQYSGEGIKQVQLTALDPKANYQQLDLFTGFEENRYQLNQAMDLINDRFGALTIAPARLLKQSSMPNVIAPAWKPNGHRQTI